MSFGVQVSDIEARWRPLDASEAVIAETLLEDAETVFISTVPGAQSYYDSGTLPQRLVTIILCEMVKRVLRNPDALSGQAVEDISQTFAGAKYDGRLYVTEDELAQVSKVLEGSAGVSAAGAATVNTVGRAIARRRKAQEAWNSERSHLGGIFR